FESEQGEAETDSNVTRIGLGITRDEDQIRRQGEEADRDRQRGRREAAPSHNVTEHGCNEACPHRHEPERSLAVVEWRAYDLQQEQVPDRYDLRVIERSEKLQRGAVNQGKG